MLIIAQNDGEAQPQVQQPQPQRPQQRPQQQQPQRPAAQNVRQPQPQRVREVDVDLDGLLRLPKGMLSLWLRNSLHGQYCGYCAQRFTSLQQYKQHLETVTQHEVYHCCGRLFPRQDSLDAHQKDKGCHDSHECNYRIRGDAYYFTYSDTIGREKLVKMVWKESLHDFLRRQLQQCSIDLQAMIDESFEMLPRWLQDSIYERRCAYCRMQLYSLNALQYHYRNTALHPVYYCCGRLFKDSDAYDRHQRTPSCLRLHGLFQQSNDQYSTKLRKLNINTKHPAFMCYTMDVYWEMRSAWINNACYYCSARLDDKEELIEHYETCVHDVYTCCGKMFHDKAILIKHQESKYC
ncbi:hypothetical protein SYNPS1DRAFT_29756 [Syncephalis pseudoplumigaleata]|uniref:C2H2-type domain-containing protein n=1 Tax=Syncephalis pseudoplumigaleata TaxID=1712513 RepID=A0A4P9YZL1_9FUNG|nr:hypothetical protein SYNPS1DRAFT_29756 [Syncephalis pseudoplumigaleata]|eukprot:RKP24480.1 hypothetical protein SYNPS1DRAFT_29756 [Syncephalis pseudoplumigaleata]